MTNLQEYKLSLFERCEAGDITKEERDLLLEAVSDDVEIGEEELEESKEISEYEESVLERFEAGLLTEEEAEMLLYEGMNKIKEASKNIKKKITKPIHDLYDDKIDIAKKYREAKKSTFEKLERDDICGRKNYAKENENYIRKRLGLRTLPVDKFDLLEKDPEKDKDIEKIKKLHEYQEKIKKGHDPIYEKRVKKFNEQMDKEINKLEKCKDKSAREKLKAIIKERLVHSKNDRGIHGVKIYDNSIYGRGEKDYPPSYSKDEYLKSSDKEKDKYHKYEMDLFSKW